MTIDERVQALAYLHVTPRQARFLVTVALHSGFCLRRHYAAFAGLRYGKNVRDFLDGLVVRRLARRVAYRVDRGYLYHLHAKSVYRALGQPDNRNRRHVSAAMIAQKLMLLDYVLSEPEAEWVATEDDKVDLFTNRFRVPLADLPQRTYGASVGEGGTTRYFIHKRPIAVAGDPPRVDLIWLVTDPSASGFDAFLADHARLLSCLPSWTVVAVSPGDGAGLQACQSLFQQYTASSALRLPTGRATDMHRYFRVRRAVETDALGGLSAHDLDTFREARTQFSAPAVDALYATWLRRGDVADSASNAIGGHAGMRRGRLRVHTLPHRYAQFGSLAGVS